MLNLNRIHKLFFKASFWILVPAQVTLFLCVPFRQALSRDLPLIRTQPCVTFQSRWEVGVSLSCCSRLGRMIGHLQQTRKTAQPRVRKAIWQREVTVRGKFWGLTAITLSMRSELPVSDVPVRTR